MKFFSFVFILLLFAGCFNSKSVFDKDGTLGKLGLPEKIEYYSKVPGRAFSNSDTADFVITQREEMQKAINEINTASDPEPWKGAGWHLLKLHYTDTVINIYTNNARIGYSRSGSFFALKKENFISKRIRDF